MNARSFYVTGTDTGIGKTVASTALLHALRVQALRAVGMKPVASGCIRDADGWRNDDALALQAASAPVPDYDDVNPFVGNSLVANASALFQFGGRFSEEVEFSHNAFDRIDTGERVYTVNLLNTRTTYQFSKEMAVRCCRRSRPTAGLLPSPPPQATSCPEIRTSALAATPVTAASTRPAPRDQPNPTADAD